VLSSTERTLPGGLLDQPTNLRFRGDVGVEVVGPAASATNVLGNGFASLIEDVGEHGDRALRGEHPGDSLADALRRAGHDGDLVLEPHGCFLP
jgi:hypothetical protein